ncbi:leucine-rich repeat-containing protein 4-like [Branchiostoma floridae]|uniref:Leucine-rich repeat-containing protein 4-like n=1 Tax=Branchiostoma floridae TaxID=7739 RepID=A0A9J7LX28_BRAFL|nr:leucine-rich repeat-containing protein 4-like [Branchiostoma floridae]
MMKACVTILLCIVVGTSARYPCPPECECGELGPHGIACGGEDMTHFPKNIPPNAVYLDVEGTKITTIPKGVFNKLHHLIGLILDQNQISTIEPGAFQGLTNMSLLSLSTNPGLSLTKVDPLILKDIQNLTRFLAQNNKLITIPTKFFSENKNLREVDLQNAGLLELQPGCFSNLKNLFIVDLSKNQIDKIGANVFTGSSNFQTLLLSNSQVKSIEPRAFETQEEMLFLMIDHNMLVSVRSALLGLKNLLTLALNDNKIVSLNEDDFKDLVMLNSLDLSNNELMDTGNALANLRSLGSLNLNNNRLTKLSFQGMPLLTDISVSNNLLQSIPERLDVITHARILDISNNPIQSLPGGRFASLNSLLKLDISNISVIQDGGLAPDALTGLHSLVELRVENNELNKVPSQALSAVKQIQILSLSHNKIETLDENDFVSVSNVSNLQLANNMLAKVPEKALRPFTNLTQLDLSGNPLVHISDWSFGNSTTLSSLRLSNAKLSVIDPAAFHDLKGVHSIDVTNNNLTWLPGDLLKYDRAFPFYLYADQGNPWYCDCQMKPFSEAVNVPGQSVITNIHCSGPEKYKGQNLGDIPLANLTCDCEHQEAPSVDTSGSDNSTAVGQPAKLRCKVGGCPTAHLFWTTPRGFVISPHLTEYTGYDVQDDGTLVIMATVAEDAGNYTCTAANYLGKAEQSHKLKLDIIET